QLSRLLEHSVLYYDRADGTLAGQPVLHEVESDHGFSQVDFRAEREAASLKLLATKVGKNCVNF
ncbi:MAG: hypothetical protein IKS45_03575, partial [Thermoguttaceae bacterium]|nr:hypothetical protein [Thermoguttaceae bacterium]